jgi:GAF domain-containing protein
MSKKKKSNRLNKLFEEITKEAERQNQSSASDDGISPKETEKSLSVPSLSKIPDSFSQTDISVRRDNAPALSDASAPISTMLSTAFRTDEKSWATLKVVDESEERSWGTEEQMLVKQVADQLSLALENARLFQEAQRRASEMTALAEVAREISATLELQKVLERIAHQAKGILHAVTSAVYVPDENFETLLAITALGVDADEIKKDPLTIGEGILGNLALKKTSAIINDASTDPQAITIEGTVDIPDEHLMAAPILSQDALSGLLAIWRVGFDQHFSETELDFLESLAQQAAIAVENARLFEETQVRAEELAVLNEMARELSAEMNINRLCETAYQYISKLIDTTNFFIALYNEKKNVLDFPLTINDGQRFENPSRLLSDGLTDYVIKSKEPLFIPENVPARMEEIGLEFIPLGNSKPALCWLGVPLMLGNRVTGAIVVQSVEKPKLFDENDKELLTAIASQVAIAFENARLFNEAQSRARREKILREITAHVRATNDPEIIAKSAVRELGQALGVSTFIYLESTKTSSNSETTSRKAKSKKKKPAQKHTNGPKGGE